MALHECVTGDILPFENKRRQKKIGINVQYIPGPQVVFLTKKVLLDQPKALIDCCIRELNILLKKKNQQIREQKYVFSPKSEVFKQGKLELYEYLILLLIHYKAFREAKSSTGKLYFYTLMPEEVLAYHRRDPKIEQYILLRETRFYRDLFNVALKKTKEGSMYKY